MANGNECEERATPRGRKAAMAVLLVAVLVATSF
jgi:hypothetical protein